MFLFLKGKHQRGTVSSGITRPGREADHSPASTAEVQNKWRYNSTPPHIFMSCAVKISVHFVLQLVQEHVFYYFP
jgi:hypothetical protein